MLTITAEEILLDLAAGRDTDALVAEHVMGWVDVRKEKTHFHPKYHENEGDAWDYWGTYVTVSPSVMRARVEDYTTSTQDAFEALRHVERLGWLPAVVKERPTGPWRAELFLNEGGGVFYEAKAHTVPLAVAKVCLLLAREVDLKAIPPLLFRGKDGKLEAI